MNGRIVFTTNKSLAGVGLPRKGNPKKQVTGWEDVKDLTGGKVEVTVTDDTLPSGPQQRQVIYEAPFVKCDRLKDYRVAWEAFSG